ncbi:MAG: hypothetical protein PVS3B2_18280 [Candidatus Dormibacteraceae bacterium]
MECAGNGRAFLNPPVPGEQWRLGAVSTAEWSGASLRDLLIPAGVSADTVEVQFQASDGFARSLPIDVALAPGRARPYMWQRIDDSPGSLASDKHTSAPAL